MVGAFVSHRALLCLSVALFVAQVDGESVKGLSIVAGEVNIQGLTHVTGVSKIKGIGQGIVQVSCLLEPLTLVPFGPGQVRDKDSRTTVLLGTSTASGSGPGMRVMPVEGTGIGLAPSSDKGGFFVSGSSSRIGVNVREKLKAPMHVEGKLLADKIVAGFDGQGPSVLLRQARSYHAVILGKPDSKGAQKYTLGRGSRAQRSLTFHAASLAEYDGTGNPPLMVYMSPNKVLAAINADTGNTYVSGMLELMSKRAGDKKPWASASKTNLDVFGSVSLNLPQEDKSGGVKIYFPFSSGENPSFSIRSNTPDQAKAVDTKLILTSGNKGAGRVGINTLKPKSTLDVRGHLYLQSDSRGNAYVHYPQTGNQAGFFLRSADQPKANDRENSRFYINPDGMVGINTLKPENGLDITAKEGNLNGMDITIKKGNLRVHDGIRHSDKRYMLQLDADNVFSEIAVEEAVSIGTSEARPTKTNHMHLQGAETPTMRIDTSPQGTGLLMLQSGKGSWSLSQGPDKHLSFNQTHGGKMPRVMVDNKGHLVVGSAEGQFGVQIETDKAFGAPENSAKISKGGLNIWGGIFKRVKHTNGKWIVWSLLPKGFSNVNGLTVNGKLAVGIEKKQEHYMFLAKHKTVSLGDTGFLGSTGEVGTMSYNEYSVLNEGKSESRLHNRKDFAAALRVYSNGQVDFEGTPARGQLKMKKLFSVDSVRGVVGFGQFADIGLEGKKEQKTPLRIKGTGAGKTKTPGTIAFGHTSQGRGHVGANDAIAFITSTDENKLISIDQTNGRVGCGTAKATHELTIVTPKPDATIMLTSNKQPEHSSSVVMKTGGSVEITTSSSPKSGKLTIQDFSTIEFNDAGDGKSQTSFDRIYTDPKDKNNKDTTSVAFESGKVGVGLHEPETTLHVNGDTWFQGKVYITKGFARSRLLENLSESFLQLDNSDSTASFGLEEDLEVVSVLEHMAKVARKNKARLNAQMSSIAQLESQLLKLHVTKK